jgi:hypothetical protein
MPTLPRTTHSKVQSPTQGWHEEEEEEEVLLLTLKGFESVLFIGTQFSILYTSTYSAAGAASSAAGAASPCA